MTMVSHSGSNWTGNDINGIIIIMKKKIICTFLIAITVMLTGCGALVSLPDISSEEEGLITEYAAGLILKYDTKFVKGNLLDEDVLAKEEVKEKDAREKERAYRKAAEEYLAKKEAAKKEEEKNKNTDSSDKDGSASDGDAVAASEQTIDNIASFYGIEGFSVVYKGYELCESYSDSSMMGVDASAGKQLIVLNFDVANVSSETQNFDMFYRNPSFYLSIDGGKKVKMQGTLMFDDMSSYVGELEAGSSKSMVLIFDIDSDISSIGNIVLTAKNGSDKGNMILQ